MDANNITQPAPETYMGVLIKPDKEEKRLIRRQYLKAGTVIVLNIVLFNYVLLGIAYLIGGIYAGDMSSAEGFKQSLTRLFSDHPWAETVISCLIPIISETCAILLGVKLLKLDLKKLFTRDGFNGKDIMMSGTICLGLQTAAAVITVIVDAVLKAFGLKSATIDMSATPDSAAATIFMYFYACLLGPVLEELLYRGVLLQGMRKYNERFALIVSSLIFGLMHQNYQQFVLGFLVGIILGAITLRSGSIVPAVIFHIIMNTTSTLQNVSLQLADYEAYLGALSGDITTDMLTSAEPMFIVLTMINALLRYGLFFAAIPLLIISMVKKRGVRKPTPAGKTRGWPILAQTWIWYVILIAYIYYNFKNITFTA